MPVRVRGLVVNGFARRMPRAASGVMLLVVLALAAAQPVPQATMPPILASDLAYVAPNGQLAVWKVGAAAPLTFGDPVRGAYAFPAWSPDGTKIAAIERSIDGARAVVFDASVADGDPVTWWDLPRRNVIYLDWSDDGSSLLLLVSDPATGFTLRRANADGFDVLARGAPLYWDQRVHGGLILHVGPPGPVRLTLREPDGTVVEDLAVPGAFRSPAASPSGRYLAISEGSAGGVTRVSVVPDPAAPAGAATLERRSLGHLGMSAFAWHPTRDLLALTRPTMDAPHTFGPLGGLDADTGLFEPWVDATVLAFWWSPEGEQLAVLATTEGGVGGNQVASLVPATQLASRTRVGVVPGGTERPVEVAPAQRAFAVRIGTYDVDANTMQWLGSVEPGAVFMNETLPFFDQYLRSHRAWSADGRHMALGTRDAVGREVIGIFDFEAGTLHELARGAMPSFAP